MHSGAVVPHLFTFHNPAPHVLPRPDPDSEDTWQWAAASYLIMISSWWEEETWSGILGIFCKNSLSCIWMLMQRYWFTFFLAGFALCHAAILSFSSAVRLCVVSVRCCIYDAKNKPENYPSFLSILPLQEEKLHRLISKILLRLNPFSCSEINLTLQYFTRIMLCLSHTLCWPNHRPWYKSRQSTYCLSTKPQRSPSFHRVNRRALLSLSLTAISPPCHTLSTSWDYLGRTAKQMLSGGSCSCSFWSNGPSHRSWMLVSWF